MSTDNLMESNPVALVVKAETQGLATWDHSKKKEFVGTFQDRTTAAIWILQKTAINIIEKAKDRKFISSKHIRGKHYKLDDNGKFIHGKGYQIGGRDHDDLINIAEERATSVLSELPQLKKIIQVIDPVTSKNLDKKEALVKKGQELTDKLEELGGAIKMSDMDQSMTIGEFRTWVKNRDKARKKLAEEIKELAEEGKELEDKINKALYAGIPGLSKAVVDVADEHMERAKALAQMSRRVEEKVLFGDSVAALDLLKHFENDEVSVDASIKAQFTAALEKLSLSKKAIAGKLKKNG
jgi:hypothetical protein